MLTNNYYVIASFACGLRSPLPNTSIRTPYNNDPDKLDYTEIKSLSAGSFSSAKVGTTYAGGNGERIILGTGDTPPAKTDYKLSGDLITTVNVLVNHSYGDNFRKVTLTITNTGTDEITIKEVGYLSSVSMQYKTVSVGGVPVLVDRTVLDTPVTIPAGGVGQVEYTITFNVPTST